MISVVLEKFKSRKVQATAKVVFLVLVVLQALSMAVKFYTSDGWDHEIYCKAAAALDKGLDPFIAENIGLKLSYTYPALFLPVYKGLCSSVGNYYVVLNLVLVAAIIFMLVKYLRVDAIIAFPFVCFGFNSVYSNFQTGNVGLWEACALSLAMVFCLRGKVWATLFLVPATFLKIIPGALALPIGLYQSKKWSSRFLAWGLFALGGLVLLGMNYWFSPQLFVSFFNQATGKYANQHSPVHELDSNASNPTVPLFFKNLATILSSDHWQILFAVFMVLMIAFSYWIWKKVIRNETDKLYRMCWSFLVLFLWFPRLKPYSLILIVIAMLPLLSRMNRRFAFSVIIVSIFHRSLNGDKANLWADFLLNNTAIYTLIAVYAFMVVRWAALQRSSEKEGA
ncbi:MAG: glycosyltransferase 87 family protein [Bdellovibrio sp.]